MFIKQIYNREYPKSLEYLFLKVYIYIDFPTSFFLQGTSLREGLQPLVATATAESVPPLPLKNGGLCQLHHLSCPGFRFPSKADQRSQQAEAQHIAFQTASSAWFLLVSFPTTLDSTETMCLSIANLICKTLKILYFSRISCCK